MKKKLSIKLLAAALVVLGLFVLVGSIIYYRNAASQAQPGLQAVEQKVTIEVKPLDGDPKSYVVNLDGQNLTALAVLQKLAKEEKSFTYTYKEASFGTFITGMLGREADSASQFWSFEVNGKQAEVGVSSYTLKAGDKLGFVLTSFADGE